MATHDDTQTKNKNMKKYFLHNGAEQQGAFDIEDLKTKNINKDTPIWYEGLDNWTTADKIDDLKELLKTTTAPPFGEPKKHRLQFKSRHLKQRRPLNNLKRKAELDFG